MLNNFSVNYYPVVADPGDHRDFLYEKKDIELKEATDLRSYSGKVRNQANLRSCTSEALISVYEILLKKDHPDKFVELSSLFVYHNARSFEARRPIVDAGVYIKDAIRAVKHYGICAESVWPFNPGQFSINPTEESYKDAKKRTIGSYYKCRNFEDLLDALNNDVPVISAIMTYSNFSRIGWDGTSELTIPTAKDILMGGHSVALVGYDIPNKKFIAKNSFGPLWGDKGYFYIPFEYAERNFMDSWIFEIKLLD
jgi:C1A family cysteine protease